MHQMFSEQNVCAIEKSSTFFHQLTQIGILCQVGYVGMFNSCWVV